MKSVTGYNSFPGSGWRRYGRLIINFHNNQAYSIYFVNPLGVGELLWERSAS